MRLNNITSQAAKDLSETKKDALLQELATKTPAEIGDFVDATFANLTPAQRKFFKVMGVVAVQFIRKNLTIN